MIILQFEENININCHSLRSWNGYFLDESNQFGIQIIAGFVRCVAYAKLIYTFILISYFEWKQNFGQEVIPELDGEVPRNWSAFLSRGDNKASLAKFYLNYMRGNAELYLNDQVLYVSLGHSNMAYKIHKESSTYFAPLDTDQEEADTRLIHHAVVDSEMGAQELTISSPDTDVLVLLVHHRPSISAAKIWFLTGRGGSKRYITVHDIFRSLNYQQHHVILVIYCVTG